MENIKSGGARRRRSWAAAVAALALLATTACAAEEAGGEEEVSIEDSIAMPDYEAGVQFEASEPASFSILWACA